MKNSFVIFLLLTFVSQICTDFLDDTSDDYLIKLLYGESIEMTSDEEKNVSDEQVRQKDGEWRCGRCDGVDPSLLIYTEVNEIDYNVEDPVELQIAISEDEMSCVTVSAPEQFTVSRVVGACAGPSVTLKITNASTKLIVNVYRDRK